MHQFCIFWNFGDFDQFWDFFLQIYTYPKIPTFFQCSQRPCKHKHGFIKFSKFAQNKSLITIPFPSHQKRGNSKTQTYATPSKYGGPMGIQHYNKCNKLYLTHPNISCETSTLCILNGHKVGMVFLSCSLPTTMGPTFLFLPQFCPKLAMLKI